MARDQDVWERTDSRGWIGDCGEERLNWNTPIPVFADCSILEPIILQRWEKSRIKIKAVVQLILGTGRKGGNL